MNTRLFTAFGLLPVLVINATACRSVGGYSDLQAQVRSTNEVKVQMYSSERPVEVVPRGQGEQTTTLTVGTYKVEMRRERESIRYSTDAGGSRLLVADGSTIPVDVTPADLQGSSPNKPLSWIHTMTLGRTNYEWKASGTTFMAHEGIVNLSTNWANVQRVTAIEHGSPVLKGIGWVGALAAYLTGAGLIAYQLNNWKSDKTVDTSLIAAGGGLIVVGIPFLVLGVKNRNYKVSVYGADKGSRVR